MAAKMSENLRKRMICDLQRPAPQLFSYGTERVEMMQFIPSLLWKFPRLPVNDVGEFQCPNEIGVLEKKNH